MSLRDHDKAGRYVAALDAARANGPWTEIPELVRKVTKHAPQRICLIQTATTEVRVLQHIIRPSSSAGDSAPSITTLRSSLLTLVQSETSPVEDAFQGRVALAWSHWVLSEPQGVVSSLPHDFGSTLRGLSQNEQALSMWTEICLIKCAYMKGAAQSQLGNPAGAAETLRAALPWIQKSKGKVVNQPQMLYWAEQLLALMARTSRQQCRLAGRDPKRHGETALQAFREYAGLVDKSPEVGPTTFGNTEAHLARLVALKSYYEFVSTILRHGSSHPSTIEASPRSKQPAELRRVESLYENELLRNSRFPKAHESNQVIEAWVEEVIQNWQILCGPSWQDAELGEGGRNAIGRDVLDVLYRAATKTFHSTLLLRRLFQVHKSLADFNLAYSAFDTYLELIERVRTKATKSESFLAGQDDDETVLRTLAEGVEGLCSFGSRDEAQRAHELALKLESWIVRLQPRIQSSDSALVNGHAHKDGVGDQQETKSISAETAEIAYRAIGVGKAHWAKWTPISENRTSLQKDAIADLTKAVSQSTTDSHHLESIYALGMIFAETRDINRAIEIVKKALTLDDAEALKSQNLATKRKLMPLWHLLSLLLTSRQDFEMAGQTCTVAFEQFPSSAMSLGSSNWPVSTQLTSEQPTLSTAANRGFVEDMQCHELERMIEIRITNMSLTEVLEGPEEAVNSSDELLALYSRLFRHLGVELGETPKPALAEPPRTSHSKAQSIRESIFRRRKPARSTPPSAAGQPSSITSVTEKEPTEKPALAADAPLIQITDEDNKLRSSAIPKSQSLRHLRGERHPTLRLHRREGSISRIIRQHSRDRKSRTSVGRESEVQDPQKTKGSTRASLSFDEAVKSKPSNPADASEMAPKPELPSQANDSSKNAQQSLSDIPHNAPHGDLPPPPGQEERPPEQDVGLGTVHSGTSSVQPTPQFPKSVSQKHALVILCKIWLVIAGLYRRAMLLEDSREACDEAEKVAARIETLVATQESSARAFARVGWGGGKSSDEIWADVLCERALLASVEKKKQEAQEHFEQALLYWPDHAKAIVGLSNILLDLYEQKTPGWQVEQSTLMSKREKEKHTEPMLGTRDMAAIEGGPMATGLRQADEDLRKTPENLNRLAARDRAYGLLSNLTKLGTGWDDAEAWYALARAYECSGQVERCRQCLWWCVELEDRRPVRHWRNVTSGSYVL